jgi:5-methylcytosine-specific restriction endonuclease McrA
VTGLIPLTVNHIDGNSENHRPENLELLCGGCHTLTPNYGRLNQGKGRRQRLEKIRARSSGM